VVHDGGRSWNPVKWADYDERGRQQASQGVAATRAQTLANIDKKIRKYEAILAQMQQTATPAI
jgi:hypothetical protein